MGDICSQFEKDDQENTFENILELMQRVIHTVNHFLDVSLNIVSIMSFIFPYQHIPCIFWQLQDLGQPPKELAGEAVCMPTDLTKIDAFHSNF